MENAQPVVLVTEPLSDRALSILASAAQVRRCTPEQAPDHIADADALVVRTYTRVDEALLSRATRLKVVGRAGVAIDNIDLPAARARGIQVVHTPAANTLAVVDYTLRMILEMNRRFWPMTAPLSPEQFHAARSQSFGRFLSDLTLGIVGAGRIGSRVGRAAAGLGMTVLFNDILDLRFDYPSTPVDKETLFRRSDIVTIHVPLTDSTRNLIDSRALSLFKPGSQFINAARGQCVDYHALAAALRSGQLSAAAIDCHHPEPPPADYPLFGLGDNVILTPHIAARVPAATEAMNDVVHDILAVLAGRPPQYPAQ
ncbi:MAG: phosphoglycerate dehydrogenase [Planctomycetota bacterium]|nr:phosphoglycerate dehydrogenase [Planctomycetota bacterium]